MLPVHAENITRFHTRRASYDRTRKGAKSESNFYFRKLVESRRSETAIDRSPISGLISKKLNGNRVFKLIAKTSREFNSDGLELEIPSRPLSRVEWRQQDPENTEEILLFPKLGKNIFIFKGLWFTSIVFYLYLIFYDRTSLQAE